jgi:transcriptional regulator with XRE-family HTH domain
VTDDERSAWGALIVERREQLDMTQEQLAQAAGVAPKTIYNMEAGGRTPQPKTLRKVQAALGLSTDIEVARSRVELARREAELRALRANRLPDVAALPSHDHWLRRRLIEAIRARHLGDWRGLLEVIEVILGTLGEEALQAVFDGLVADPLAPGAMRLVTKQHPISRGPVSSDPSDSMDDAIAASEEGSIAGEQESRNDP